MRLHGGLLGTGVIGKWPRKFVSELIEVKTLAFL